MLRQKVIKFTILLSLSIFTALSAKKGGKNIAPQAEVKVDSVIQNYTARKAIDGKRGKNDRWIADPNKKNHFIELSWKKPQKIGRIKLESGIPNKNGYLIVGFKVLYWFKNKWQVLKIIEKNKKPVLEITVKPITTTKLKLDITKPSPRDNYARIIELEVFAE